MSRTDFVQAIAFIELLWYKVTKRKPIGFKSPWAFVFRDDENEGVIYE